MLALVSREAALDMISMAKVYVSVDSNTGTLSPFQSCLNGEGMFEYAILYEFTFLGWQFPGLDTSSLSRNNTESLSIFTNL